VAPVSEPVNIGWAVLKGVASYAVMCMALTWLVLILWFWEGRARPGP
jgi:hypothetical protein